MTESAVIFRLYVYICLLPIAVIRVAYTSLPRGDQRFGEIKSRIHFDQLYSARGNYEGSAKLQSQCNSRLYDTRGSYERKLQSQCNGQLGGAPEAYEGAKLQSQCNGYVSIDESEYTTDDTDSEDYQNEAGSLDRGNSAPSALLNCCDSSEYSLAFEDEYADTRRHSTTSQELEALYANGTRFVNTEAEMPPEAKSLMLSMVASQEDILETKKHLRSTPVLDNLLGTTTPECKLIDVNPELGKLIRMRFL